MDEPNPVGRMPQILTGSYYVRTTKGAFGDAYRLFPRARDFFEAYRHAMKLRFWPEQNPVDQRGQVLDLDWEWITALKGLHIGELRIDDRIGGHDNLRIIFFVGDKKVARPLPMIWILQVLQKKRMDFTAHNLTTFKGRRKLVIERHYKYHDHDE